MYTLCAAKCVSTGHMPFATSPAADILQDGGLMACPLALAVAQKPTHVLSTHWEVLSTGGAWMRHALKHASPISCTTSAHLYAYCTGIAHDCSTGIKGFPTRGFPFRLDLASLVGPLFFMWVMQLLLPVSTATVL